MNSFKSLTKSKFFKFGAPFFALVLGGSLGLEQFARVRYEFRSTKPFTPEDAKAHGINMKPHSEITIEKEYEKLTKTDIDHWENIRGPRPWEEDTIKLNLEKQKNKIKT